MSIKTRLPIFVDGLAQGDVLKALGELAKQANPELHEVVAKTVQLSQQEFGEFMRVVHGRLDAIKSLQKICESVDFKKAKNEDELHSLLEQNPWLIDPTFTQFLVSNEWVSTMLRKLAEHLGVAEFAEAEEGGKKKGEKDDDRPDLVFVLGNLGLERVVIVELKAPNIPLAAKHLDQLRKYTRKTRQWLKEKGHPNVKIEGYLIGSMPDPGSKAEGAEVLREQIEEESQGAGWQVFDLLELLGRTSRAHEELLAIYNEAAAKEMV